MFPADSIEVVMAYALRLQASRNQTTGFLWSPPIGKTRFVLLERIAQQEIILGLIGKFWTPDGQLQKFHPDEFRHVGNKHYSKATWNFELIPQPGNRTLLRTETRVLYTSRPAQIKFSFYWFFIQPFSTRIRKEILQSIQQQATGKV